MPSKNRKILSRRDVLGLAAGICVSPLLDCRTSRAQDTTADGRRGNRDLGPSIGELPGKWTVDGADPISIFASGLCVAATSAHLPYVGVGVFRSEKGQEVNGKAPWKYHLQGNWMQYHRKVDFNKLHGVSGLFRVRWSFDPNQKLISASALFLRSDAAYTTVESGIIDDRSMTKTADPPALPPLEDCINTLSPWCGTVVSSSSAGLIAPGDTLRFQGDGGYGALFRDRTRQFLFSGPCLPPPPKGSVFPGPGATISAFVIDPVAARSGRLRLRFDAVVLGTLILSDGAQAEFVVEKDDCKQHEC
jgi:hypothetical protein